MATLLLQTKIIQIFLSLSLVAQETEPSILPSEHALMKSVKEGVSWLLEL